MGLLTIRKLEDLGILVTAAHLNFPGDGAFWVTPLGISIQPPLRIGRGGGSHGVGRGARGRGQGRAGGGQNEVLEAIQQLGIDTQYQFLYLQGLNRHQWNYPQNQFHQVMDHFQLPWEPMVDYMHIYPTPLQGDIEDSDEDIE